MWEQHRVLFHQKIFAFIFLVLVNKPTTLLKVTLLHGCFSRILHYTNDTTSCWALHMFICVPMFFVSVCDTTEC